MLGKFYRGKNMYNESLVAFQEVLELSPNKSDAYMGMGITYGEMGEKQLAREFAAAAITSSSFDPEQFIGT